ncbi:MAG: hypothetical protein JSS07_03395 [Proteobacteria bacterium]|nr:hypothetical protein [Pseudomonadota bacterium]
MALGPNLPVLNAFEKKQNEEAFNKKQNDEEKRLKKIVKKRMEQRRSVCFDNGEPETHDEGSIAGKIRRLGDLNPETLVGETLATLIIHLFESLFATQFFIQQREFSDAKQLDRAKEARIASGQAQDDGIRLAYEPLRDPNDGFKTLLTDAKGALVYPAVYPMTNGQVDYTRTPNTDGTASRFAIRANGFVPVEDFQEAYTIQFLKFQKDMAGDGDFTPSQKAMLNMFAQEGGKRAQKNASKDAQDAFFANNRPAVPTPTPRPGK